MQRWWARRAATRSMHRTPWWGQAGDAALDALLRALVSSRDWIPSAQLGPLKSDGNTALAPVSPEISAPGPYVTLLVHKTLPLVDMLLTSKIAVP